VLFPPGQYVVASTDVIELIEFLKEHHADEFHGNFSATDVKRVLDQLKMSRAEASRNAVSGNYLRTLGFAGRDRQSFIVNTNLLQMIAIGNSLRLTEAFLNATTTEGNAISFDTFDDSCRKFIRDTTELAKTARRIALDSVNKTQQGEEMVVVSNNSDADSFIKKRIELSSVNKTQQQEGEMVVVLNYSGADILNNSKNPVNLPDRSLNNSSEPMFAHHRKDDGQLNEALRRHLRELQRRLAETLRELFNSSFIESYTDDKDGELNYLINGTGTYSEGGNSALRGEMVYVDRLSYARMLKCAAHVLHYISILILGLFALQVGRLYLCLK